MCLNLHLKKRWDIPRQREGGEKASTTEVASGTEMASSLQQRGLWQREVESAERVSAERGKT